MFEDITPESIKGKIFESLSLWDTREGSFVDILAGPLAYVTWETLQSMNAVFPIIFVEETSGKYIDMTAMDYGLIRKEGRKAKVVISVMGDKGAILKSGNVVLDGDGHEFIVIEDIILNEEGIGIGEVEAVNIGDDYNVEANTIVNLYRSINGIQAITNEEDATGGTNEETDKSFVQRLYDHWQKPATSGNVYHYHKWALEVNGIGAVKIFPLWDGNGTVKIVIADSNILPASDDIVADCFKHIESVRPIGATVTVESAVEKPINISCKIQVDNSRVFTDVEKEIQKGIDDYIKSVAFAEQYIRYNRIAYVVLGTNGVIDYESLKVNDTTGNIAINDTEIPVLNNCEVSK